ncbi:MAG: NUDIX domain-containing protein [archaeon]|nr:NUDIX domain-containing protein [archaeon]
MSLLSPLSFGGVQWLRGVSAVVVVNSRCLSASQRAEGHQKYYPKPHPPGNWRIVGGTILERPPQVLTDTEPWESEFISWFDKGRAAIRKAKGLDPVSKPSDTVVGSYFERIEKRLPEIEGGLQPRVTEADRRNNVRSLRRALPQRLFLVMKKSRGEFPWQLPQGDWRQGETIRQTAQNRLADSLGDKHEAYFLSNAPSVHIEYDSSPEYKAGSGFDGTKVFWFRAFHIGGPIKLPEGIVDFAWLTADELEHHLAPNIYQRIRPAITEY